MTELIGALGSPWPLLLVSVGILFSVPPRFLLRLVVLLYPKHSPKRSELLAELDWVPRSSRSFWVAEQVEVALFEGLSARIRHWRTRATAVTSLNATASHVARLAGQEKVGLARLLVAIAVRLLPCSQRARYLEEFRAELADLSRWRRPVHALSLIRGAYAQGKFLRRAVEEGEQLDP